jgi:hypothetical protein
LNGNLTGLAYLTLDVVTRPNIVIAAFTVSLALAALTVPAAVAAPAAARAGLVRASAVAPAFRCSKQGEHPVSANVDFSGLHAVAKKTTTTAGTAFRFELSGTIAFTLHLAFTGAITCTATGGKVTLPTDTPFAVQIGPDFEFTATGKVEGDFTWSPAIDFGFTLSASGITHRVHTLSSHGIVAFSGAGSASLRLALAVDVGRSVGNVVNVGMGGDIGPTITATVSTRSADSSTCWSLTGRGVAKLTAHVQVWKWLNKNWTIATKTFGHFGVPRHCIGNAPVVTQNTFVNKGIQLTYTPPTLQNGTALSDYICQVSPDGGTTVYPCNSADGNPSGVGTTDPALAAPEVLIGTSEVTITPGWSIAMAAVTNTGQGNFGPWFKLSDSLAAPVINSASQSAPGADIHLDYVAPKPPRGLTIADYKCEVSPDGGSTVHPCDAGGGPANGIGTADPTTAPGEVLIGITLVNIQPGWSIRIWAVTPTCDSPKSHWFTITG